MKQFFIFFFVLSCSLQAVGQTGKITGSVQDAETKAPLELATVSILRQDSGLVSYRLSSKDGLFSFDKLPLKEKLLVSVTYTGYKAYHSTLELSRGKTDTLAVYLALHFSDTNAVVITTTAPVRMNGDTLELNPAAFKMKEDAVVEELLNQVAGITIWSDGSITVNGKKVQSLLVDGKPFLGSTDTRVATQNLPKAAIDKIQLYQEYDRSKINQQSGPQDSLLTMNIKLKESSKKGYFGKAGAGYGTTNRFESDLSFQLYNKKSSVGIGGGINNINKSIGNLQELFQNNTYRNYNPNLYSVGRFGANGINQNHSIGAVATHNFIESVNSRQNNRLTVNYNTSGTNTFLTDLTLQDRIALQNPQFIRESGVQNNRNDRHDVGFHYIKTNSYDDNLNLRGSVNKGGDRGRDDRNTEVRDSAGRLQSTNNISTLHNRRLENAQADVQFAKTDRDDPLKNFSLQLMARTGKDESKRTVQSLFYSAIDRSKNASFNRLYTSANESVSAFANLDYVGFKRFLLGRYNFFGINLHFSQNLIYNRNTTNTRVDDYDSTAGKYYVNSNLTNRNRRELLEYAPILSLSKAFHKWNEFSYQSLNVQVRMIEDIKTEKNQSTFLKRNLDRSFRFFRYDGNVSFQRTKRDKYQHYSSLNYTKNFEFPSIDQLYTLVDDINAYDIRVGNPGLKNQIQHNLNLNANFSTQNPKSLYSVNGNVNGGYNLTLHPSTDSVINDPSGKRVSYFINADQRSSLNLNSNFNVSRKFKKNSLQLQYYGRISTGRTPNFIDGVYNTSTTSSLSNGYSLQFSFGSLLVLNLGQNFEQYGSRQSISGLRSFTNSSSSSKLGVVVNYPTNFTFSSTVDHILNSNLNKPTILWNAFATYRILNKQGELKLAAMDILKQYQAISNSANSFGTVTRVTNGLQQFFLLTFSYYPRNFGKTAIKKQAQEVAY